MATIRPDSNNNMIQHGTKRVVYLFMDHIFGWESTTALGTSFDTKKHNKLEVLSIGKVTQSDST